MPIDNDVYKPRRRGMVGDLRALDIGCGAAGERPTAAKPCQRVHVAVDPHARVRRPRDSTPYHAFWVRASDVRRRADRGAVNKFRKR